MPQQAVLVGLTAGMVAAEGKAAGNKTMMQKQQASSCCSDRDQDMADLELALEAVVPVSVQRQDSLYRDATRAGGGGQQQHEGWARTLRLAFQCVGVLYGDIGTSPLYVYSSTFAGGIRDTDDLLGVLSLIIYSFLLFTIIKYVYIALRANDDGDGGTLALYSLISRHAKVSLVPNHQPEDELQTTDAAAAVLGKHGSVRRRTVQLAASHGREQRAVWVKELLETSKPVRISLFFLTIVATAMVISDACLTPAISVLSAVGGLKEKAPNLTTDQIVWITVGILVLLFAVQRFGTHKVGYLFAPVSSCGCSSSAAWACTTCSGTTSPSSAPSTPSTSWTTSGATAGTPGSPSAASSSASPAPRRCSPTSATSASAPSSSASASASSPPCCSPTSARPPSSAGTRSRCPTPSTSPRPSPSSGPPSCWRWRRRSSAARP
uniref:K+ potassium transporter integral membrane domain-containing protein n=1 Tax=Zea mays TaxID=4577 RepID=A0A804MX52_MAIZE